MELDVSGGNGAMEDIDSTCSTPYVSAPSSPGRSGGAPFAGGGGYFFSAPASPMHFVLSASAAAATAGFSSPSGSVIEAANSSFEFEFSGRNAALSSADELFLNGRIRPMKLSSHLQRPQMLSPLVDEDEDEEQETQRRNNRSKQGDVEEQVEGAENSPMMGLRGRDLRFRSGSIHRRTRSMSPLRNPRHHWAAEDEEEEEPKTPKPLELTKNEESLAAETMAAMDSENTPPSGSSSRSSSSGRNSKRWIFLKDLLYRSKSEGREREHRVRDKFWQSLSFSPSSAFILNLKDRSSNNKSSSPSTQPKPSSSSDSNLKQKQKQSSSSCSVASASTASGTALSSGKKRRIPRPSPHERHYTANRAQAEEMRKRTFLPYRQGLLGCLGFSSRSYGAMNGLARSLNTVYSR